jgi:hypothetical protein
VVLLATGRFAFVELDRGTPRHDVCACTCVRACLLAKLDRCAASRPGPPRTAPPSGRGNAVRALRPDGQVWTVS